MKLEIDIFWLALLCCYVALLAFGFWFDRHVGKQEQRNRLDGSVALMVVIGVSVTLLMVTPVVVTFLWQFGSAPVNGLFVMLLVMGGFVCSGFRMFFGSMERYYQRREAQAQQERDRLRDLERDITGVE